MTLYNYPNLPTKLLEGDIIRISPPNIAELRLAQFDVKKVIIVLRGGNGALGINGIGSKFAVQLPILPTTLIHLTPGGNAEYSQGGFSGGGHGSSRYPIDTPGLTTIHGGGGGGCAILKVDGALKCVAAGGGGSSRAYVAYNTLSHGRGGSAPSGAGYLSQWKGGEGGTATSGYAQFRGGNGAEGSSADGAGGGGAGYYGGYGGGLAPNGGGLPGGAGSNYINSILQCAIPEVVDTPGMGYCDILVIRDQLVRINKNGIWKESKKVNAKYNGIWKEAKTIYAKNNGVWKESK